MPHSRPRYYTPIGRGNEDLGAASTCHAVAARAAVGSAAPMSVAVNAADLQLHWQYVRRSRVHGNQRSCTCGMLAAQVLVATADRRVSRPRVRQSAAQSRHQLLPARGARGACKSGAYQQQVAIGWERHAVAQVDTGASCAGAKSILVGMATAASAHQPQL